MPERHEKRRRSKQGLARARLVYRRDLAWTRGFPVALVQGTGESMDELGSAPNFEWMSLTPLYGPGTIESHCVDREWIRRAEFAASKLRHQFPKCIPQLAADPEGWLARLDRLLSACKSVLHDGAPAESIGQAMGGDAHPRCEKTSSSPQIPGPLSIEPLLAAVRIADSLAPAPIGASLSHWLRSHRRPLERLLQHTSQDQRKPAPGADRKLTAGQREALLLITLFRSFPIKEDLLRLIETLTHPGIGHLPTADINQQIGYEANRIRNLLNQLNSGKESTSPSSGPPSAASPLRPAIIRQLERVLQRKPAERTAVVRFLSQLGQSGFLAELDRISAARDSELRRLRGVRTQMEQLDRAGLIPRQKKARQLLRKEAEPDTLPEDAERWLGMVNQFVAREWLTTTTPPLVDAVADWLGAAGPQQHLAWTVMADLWKMRYDPDKIAWQSVAYTDLFRQLARFATELPGSEWGKLFLPLFARTGYGQKCELFDPWLDPHSMGGSRIATRRHGKRQLAGLIDYLISLYRSGAPPQTAGAINSIGAAWRVFRDPHKVDLFIRQLDSEALDFPIDLDDLEALSPFVDEPLLAANLSPKINDGSIDASTLRQLAPLAKHPVGKRVILDWLQRHAFDRLEHLGAIMHSLKSANRELPKTVASTEASPWIHRYPPELREPLRDLATLCPHAEQIARETLRQDFVDAPKRIAELKYLQSQLRKSGHDEPRSRALARRCQRIRELLKQPSTPSPSRLRRLQARLRRRALLESERWLLAAAIQQLALALQESGLELADDRMTDRQIQRILAGLLELPPHERRLGLRLLSLSEQERGYPERDHPENEAYLQRIQERGIRLQPWLEATRQWPHPIKGNRYLTVTLSNAPLDYLLMGQHFKTCLSPGDFNFFSTISSAIDVNKRVLYVRNEQGRIEGRCLIALGPEGELVRYRVYAHERYEQVQQAVEAALHELAAELGTTRSATAKVPLLAARRWYDDGIVGPDGKSAISPRAQLQKQLRSSGHLHCPSVIQRRGIEAQLAACLEAEGALEMVDAIVRREGLQWILPADWVLQRVLDLLEERRAEPTAYRTLATYCWEAKHPTFMESALNRISAKQMIRLFRRSTCHSRGCFQLHDLGGNEFVAEWLRRLEPHLALRALRASRKREIRTDLDEVCPDRRQLLAEAHSRLGRKRLPALLRQSD